MQHRGFIENMYKQIVQSTTLSVIPREVVFHRIFSACTVAEIFSFARASKANYKEYVEKFKGLWDRNIDVFSHGIVTFSSLRNIDFSSIGMSANPLLMHFTFIDGYRKLIKDFEEVNSLFIKNKWLFKSDREFFIALGDDFFRNAIRSLSVNYELKHGSCLLAYIDSLKTDLETVADMQHAIFRSRALLVLNFFVSFFEMTLKWLPLGLGFSISFFEENYFIRLVGLLMIGLSFYAATGSIDTITRFLEESIPAGIMAPNVVASSSFYGGQASAICGAISVFISFYLLMSSTISDRDR